MKAKSKVSPDGTYVFDAEDIEQLDELSLTAVLRSVVDDSSEHVGAEPKPSEIAAPSAEGDTTINKILDGSPSSNDEPPAGLPEPPETTGDLLSPDLIFSELPPRRR